jgi:hypothetical protein
VFINVNHQTFVVGGIELGQTICVGFGQCGILGYKQTTAVATNVQFGFGVGIAHTNIAIGGLGLSHCNAAKK